MAKETQIPAPTSYASPHAIARLGARLRTMRARAGFRTTGYFLTHPNLPRWIFKKLRKIRPIFMLGGFVIVTRHDDVTSVLNRSQDFELGLFARDRMLAGNFILNTDWPRSHGKQEGLLRTALFPSSGPSISDLARDACDKEMAKAGTQLDVAAFARYVSLHIIQRFYGVSADDVDEGNLSEWLTELASAIILLPPHGMPERVAADKAAINLRRHVLKLINDVDVAQSNTLSRLVHESRQPGAPKWMNDDWIARMVSGLVVFGMATVVRTASDTIDELLRRPDAINLAVTAAQQAKNDPKALKRIIYEALRFRPMLPVLARYCPRATIIGTRDDRRRVVSAGSSVWAPPLAGMHDPDVFKNPSDFLDDRDPDLSLVFGSGLHKCIGRAIAEDALIEIVGAILRQPAVKRLPGRKGKIVYKGAAADRLLIGIRT